jgi:hypothetical protein
VQEAQVRLTQTAAAVLIQLLTALLLRLAVVVAVAGVYLALQEDQVVVVHTLQALL